MAATPPGIAKVDRVGRKGRNGRRTGAGTCYEVKAYDRQTKQTVYVGRYDTVEEARKPSASSRKRTPTAPADARA